MDHSMDRISLLSLAASADGAISRTVKEGRPQLAKPHIGQTESCAGLLATLKGIRGAGRKLTQSTSLQEPLDVKWHITEQRRNLPSRAQDQACCGYTSSVLTLSLTSCIIY